MTGFKSIYKKALNLEPLTTREGVLLYNSAPLEELMFLGSSLRHIHVPGNNVGWQIDRNVNITNICFSQCKFCNFCRKPGDTDTYITTIEQYEQKIEDLFRLGGNQLLLQGGMHPGLGISFYEDLFRSLKERFPELKLHALGPPEVAHLAHKDSLSFREVLERLVAAGLDSLPGAGAEILAERVRKIVSPAKATAAEWLDVMREAHIMNLPTSATMMFGHVESIEERIEHLVSIRSLQYEKPQGNMGFISFIPWPFQDEGTVLAGRHGVRSNVSRTDYLRLIAVSRIMLTNITNIQTSVLTTGRDTGIMALRSG
ncbi:MAG: CofH family radical SAM protein, partial [Bacteroidales bacterium]|nr:CofH family radical SAM protein [Bacteroidales bacterium]